jgi:hypothetical protein
MAFYRGEQGFVKFDKDASSGISTIAAVRTWSLTVEKEQLEVTAHADNSRKYVGGLVGGSGSIEVLYDAPSAGDKLDLLNESLIVNDTANAHLELYLATGKKLSFDALITGAEYAATVGEIEVINVNFTCTGTITSAI